MTLIQAPAIDQAILCELPWVMNCTAYTMPGPQPTAHQVLVYSGPGVSPLSLSYTLLTLSLLLTPHYTVQPVTPEVLAQQPWEPACALLVIPGGRDLPYVEELTTKTRVTKRIREFVKEGGKYLGICAGAYFGAEEVRFDVGGGLEVAGKRELVSLVEYAGDCTDNAGLRARFLYRTDLPRFRLCR